MRKFSILTFILLHNFFSCGYAFSNLVRRRTEHNSPQRKLISEEYAKYFADVNEYEYPEKEHTEKSKENFTDKLSSIDTLSSEQLDRSTDAFQVASVDEIERASPNIMDLPIPSDDRPFLVNPLLPQGSEKGLSSHSIEPKSFEKCQTSESGSPCIDPQTPKDMYDGLTSSGVRLSFVGFPDSKQEEPLDEQEVSISSWLINATREAFKSFKDWFRANILRRPIPLSRLIQMFKDNAASIPENYNSDYVHDDEFYNVGYSFAPKIKRGESPAKYSRTGQDSFFISKAYEKAELALGLAEGINDWLPKYHDSSDFSRELCHSMKAVFANSKTKSKVTPSELSKAALEVVKVSPKVDEGSSTALVAVFTSRKKVLVGNLGMSQAMLFRDGTLKYITETSVNENGKPRRLTKAFRLKSGSKYFLADSFDSASHVEWELMKGDSLLFVSHSIVRNLHSEEYERSIRDGVSTKSHASSVSSNILAKALFQSLQSPDKMRFPLIGGYQDDMIVIMVQVKT